ncbi:hypothetical protein C8R45DRAFT_1075815 [Mycena sanguinolenta]|nr:hypothetical protein C8R45DRAFT_1075815 [Mycena sanguinolenta]
MFSAGNRSCLASSGRRCRQLTGDHTIQNLITRIKRLNHCPYSSSASAAGWAYDDSAYAYGGHGYEGGGYGEGDGYGIAGSSKVEKAYAVREHREGTGWDVARGADYTDRAGGEEEDTPHPHASSSTSAHKPRVRWRPPSPPADGDAQAAAREATCTLPAEDAEKVEGRGRALLFIFICTVHPHSTFVRFIQPIVSLDFWG